MKYTNVCGLQTREYLLPSLWLLLDRAVQGCISPQGLLSELQEAPRNANDTNEKKEHKTFFQVYIKQIEITEIF